MANGRLARAARVAAVVGLVAAAVAPRAGFAAAAGADDYAAVDATVRAAGNASAVPGLAYALVRDGAVVHQAAFGIAAPDGRPMTTATPLVIGSVGKSITALAVRQLVDAGLIDLGAPVSRYLPWFRLAGESRATDAVTIRSLLQHTSGLSTADGQDPRWYAAGRSPEDVVRGLATVAPDRPAGTYEYSNLNYVVLGVVVEAVSGESYADYLQEHVFGPLGMTRSFTSLEAARQAAPAQGYRYLFGAPVPFDEPYPTGIVAAGYQVSTAADMARFAAALANGGSLDGRSVVASAGGSREALGTDWQVVPGPIAASIVSQSGSTLATNAVISVLPASHLGVVVLMNANPTQFMGLAAGASDVGMAALRAWTGIGSASSAPSVTSVYLVLDLALIVLAVLLLLHAIRARTWNRRWRAGTSRRMLVARTVIADLVLPLVVLVAAPLSIGSTGSAAAGDPLAGWAFALWTLPDLTVALIVLSLIGLGLGAAKLVVVGLASRRRPQTQRRGAGVGAGA